MKSVVASAAVLAATLIPATAAVGPADPDPVIVHEWGTFTSIADEQGQPIEWAAYGRQDLPCFVERFKFLAKETVWGTVRMETPVLYFYAPQPTTVRASVKFRNGLITEWFPRATVTPRTLGPSGVASPGFVSTVSWPEVKILPDADETYPTEAAANHYYAARRTDATPIAVASQREKFLFYRGVGGFPIPLSATEAADGRIAVNVSGGDPLAAVIAFENRDGRIGYDIRSHVLGRETLLQPRTPGSVDALAGDLVQTLTAEGLYAAEARAMVETWRDTWFEHGSRLFYIVPERTVDSVLPLEITPKPAGIKRVFVGRVELLTTATKEDLMGALARSDAARLEMYGRFLQPMMRLLLPDGQVQEAFRRSAEQTVSRVQTAAVLRATVCR